MSGFGRFMVCQQTGVYPYPLALGRGVCETKSKKGAQETENPFCIGFAALRGGLRPWSQTMVSEGARPWGRGRSEFAEFLPNNCRHNFALGSVCCKIKRCCCKSPRLSWRKLQRTHTHTHPNKKNNQSTLCWEMLKGNCAANAFISPLGPRTSVATTKLKPIEFYGALPIKHWQTQGN